MKPCLRTRNDPVVVLDTSTALLGERWASIPAGADRVEVFYQGTANASSTVELRRKVDYPDTPGDKNALDVRRGAAVTLNNANGITFSEVYALAPGVGQICVRATTAGAHVRAMVAFWGEGLECSCVK